MHSNRTAALAALVLAGSMPLVAQDPATCPMHAKHMGETERKSKVDERGDHVMGFDHTRTGHHFLLRPDGGVIEVTAADAADRESIAAIRRHLEQVAVSFRAGDFEMPMLIHGKTPPGVPELQRLKTEVVYVVEPVEKGARVKITAKGRDALAAIHAFLKFQIEDHRTGDPTAVK